MDRNNSTKKFMQYEIGDEANGINYVGYDERRVKPDNKKLLFFCVFPLILLVIGIVLIILAHAKVNSCDDSSQVATENQTSAEDICLYSSEAKRIGLPDFLKNLREVYFDMFPEEIAWKPLVDEVMIKQKFAIHDPRAENIKRITDKAKELLDQAVALNPDLSKLKPREHKSYLQMLHFLESTFGWSYLNYTAGLWLMGPSGFCSEPICLVQYGLYNSVGSMKPYDEDGINKLLHHFQAFNKSIHDYIDVMKLGIKRGMVRTQVECTAGIDALKEYHLNISLNGEQGIRGEWYVEKFYDPSFFTNISEALNNKYVLRYNQNVSEFIEDAVLKFIGRPIAAMLEYLDKDHYRHCRPDEVGPGGLSALPLDYIYLDGNKTNKRTDPFLKLCNGENCRLNGSEAYRSILGYFTTTNIHPNEVHELGWKNLNRIYPQVIDIAKSVTKLENETAAIEKFQEMLLDRKTNYFNEEPLPENETRGEAFIKCNNEEGAKKYCPNRWKAMMKWFKFAQMAMSIHDPNTVDFFYFTGDQKSTPSCPVILRPNFNPSSAAQSYDNSDVNCTYPCEYNIPFFLEDLGPKSSEYSVNAHEARPGHHTQVQGLIENFRDKCGGPEGWLDDKTYYTAFTEGWALYAESPLIAESTNIYDDNPIQKYGMFKWQIWRALRLIVDTGLHYKGFTRQQASDLFGKYAWDNTDLTTKEVTRYQSNYGQATAYMIGQLVIWRLRNKTEEALGLDYTLKDFHLQALSQGSSPLAYLESYMNKYIQCRKNPSGQFCDNVLDPTRKSETSHPFVRNSKMKYPKHRHYL